MKYLITMIIMFLMLLGCGATTRETCDLNGVNSADYATLAEADIAAVSLNKPLIITRHYEINAPTTLVSDIIFTVGSFIRLKPGTILHLGTVSNPSNKQCYVNFKAGQITGLDEAKPEWFGARGDGISYDGEAINIAISALPEGGKVILSSGKNYVIDQTLNLSSRSLSGYGATISRPNTPIDIPVYTEIQADNTRAITVKVDVTSSDYNKLRVGMAMTFINRPGHARRVDHLLRTISVIDGENITLTGQKSTIASPANTLSMVNVFPLIKTYGSVTIEGLTIEGNKHYYPVDRVYWENGMSITTGFENYQNGLIRDCVFRNAIADGVMIGGQTIVQNNKFLYSGAGGVHLSGAVGAKVIGNYIFDSNLNVLTGHNEAAIIYSAAVYDTLISGNTLDTCLNGIGQVNSSWNSKAEISNNTIRNFKQHGVYLGSIPQENLTNITNNFVISSNLFIASNRDIETSEIKYSYVPTNPVSKATGYGVYVKEWNNLAPVVVNKYENISISGNTFQDCGALIQNTIGFSLSSNSFVDRSSYSSFESTSEEIIGTSASTGTISGNSIVSYPSGPWRKRVFTFFSGGAYPNNIIVSGNSISTQLAYYNVPLQSGINLIFQSVPVDINNIATNSDFSSGDVAWNKQADWSIIYQNGGYQAVADRAINSSIYQAMPMVSGKKYRLTFVISEYIQGSINGHINSVPISSPATGTGTYSTEFVSNGNAQVGLITNDATIAKVSKISLVECSE